MLKGESPLPPDYGPSEVSERSGLVCLGALPWVVNYNLVLQTEDLSKARQIARAVSTRGGVFSNHDYHDLVSNDDNNAVLINTHNNNPVVNYKLVLRLRISARRDRSRVQSAPAEVRFLITIIIGGIRIYIWNANNSAGIVTSLAATEEQWGDAPQCTLSAM
jgi:glutamate formiminotransferase